MGTAGFAAAHTGQTATQACKDLKGDHLNEYEGSAVATATCTNNPAGTAATFTVDVSACAKKQCNKADSPNGVFDSIGVKMESTVDCATYDVNMKGGKAVAQCIIGSDGKAAWSDEVDVSKVLSFFFRAWASQRP